MHNCKTLCSSNWALTQVAVDGDYGPNVQRDERNGEDYGECQEQD
jgi:hypothetical protein